MQDKVLIVDDDDHLRIALQEYFSREGFDVSTAADGVEALEQVNTFQPDVIILDVVLPRMDGLEVCREVRQQIGQTIGIIMFSTPKQADPDMEVGLMVGADVYLPKPVRTRVLLAQVKALLRRLRTQSVINTDTGWFVIDEDLRVHFKRHKVETGDKEVSLTPLEYKLLKYLIDRPNEPCTQADLMDEVWGDNYYDDSIGPGALTTCVSKLRSKIEPTPSKPKYILNKSKVGYYFNMPEE